MTSKQIILRSNLANQSIAVEQKSATVDKENNTVQVKIQPKEGFNIKAKDFSHGLLDGSIQKILFSDSGPNVMAIVHIRVNKLLSGSVVDLPISVITRANHHNIKITEELNVSAGVITKYTSAFSTSVTKNGIVYSARNDLGEKTLLFTRSFVVPKGQQFDSLPTFQINKNKERFNVVVSTKTRNKKVAIATYEVYYTSPQKYSELEELEKISFIANGYAIESSTTTVAPTSPAVYGSTTSLISTTEIEDDFKIYSFDAGRVVGSEGGIRRMSVKGVPGTEFKLLLQDSNKKTYNFKKGKYEEGGGMLVGKIPMARKGFSYGEYIARVVVPKTTTSVSYSDRIIKDATIDHSKITSVEKANLETVGKVDILTEIKINPTTSITISFDLTGGYATDFADIVFGPEAGGSTISGNELVSFKIKAPAGKSIAVNRQPVQDGQKSFVAWDSGDKADADTSAGVDIFNDWSNVRVATDGLVESSVVNIKSKFTLAADARSVKGTMSIGSLTFGEGNNTYNLTLNNFLTLTAL